MAKTSDKFWVKDPKTNEFVKVNDIIPSASQVSTNNTYNNFIDKTFTPVFKPFSFNNFIRNSTATKYGTFPDDPDAAFDFSKFYNETGKSSYVLNPKYCGYMPRFSGYTFPTLDFAFSTNIFLNPDPIDPGDDPGTKVSKTVRDPATGQPVNILKYDNWKNNTDHRNTYCIFYVNRAGAAADQIWVCKKFIDKNGKAYFNRNYVSKINASKIGDFIVFLAQAGGGGGGRCFNSTESLGTDFPSWFSDSSFCRTASGASGAHAYARLNMAWLKGGRPLFHLGNMDTNLAGTDIFGIFTWGKKQNLGDIDKPGEYFYEIEIGWGGKGGHITAVENIDPADGGDTKIYARTFKYSEWIDKNSNNIDSGNTSKVLAFRISGGKGGRNSWKYDLTSTNQPAGGEATDYNIDSRYCKFLYTKKSMSDSNDNLSPAIFSGLPGNAFDIFNETYLTRSLRQYFIQIYPTCTNYGTGIGYQINNKCYNCHDGQIDYYYGNYSIIRSGAHSYFNLGGCQTADLMTDYHFYEGRGGSGGGIMLARSGNDEWQAFTNHGGWGFIWLMFSSIDLKEQKPELSQLYPMITNQADEWYPFLGPHNVLDSSTLLSTYDQKFIYSDTVDPVAEKKEYFK